AEMMARFQLGFAPDGWDHLSEYLVARDVDPALALEAGLLQPRDSGGHYDRFRNRLLFPIKDRDGRTVGFGGRALGDAQPKYLNSPQTPVFDKSTLLYGLDLAKDAIRKADRVVIVEGYMDVIAAHQFGHANVVAAMGTAVTEAQIGLVKRLTKRIALALDADAAGQMATIRSLETMQQSLDREETPVPDAMGVIRFERKLNAEISIVTLPEGKDPDELIRRAPDIWPAIVESAQPFLDFYIDQAVKRAPLDDPKAKSAVVSLVSPLLRQIPDRIVQAHYVELLASRLRVDQRLVLAEVRRAHLVGGGKDAAAEGRRSSLPKRSSHEDHLVALLLQQRALCRDILPNVPMEYLHDERNRQIIEVLRDDAIPDLDAHQLIAGFDDPIADHAERLLEGLVGKPSLLPGQIRREAVKSLDQLGKERFTFLLQELQAEISEAQREGDSSLVGELVPRLSALIDRHRGFYPPKSPYFKDSRDTGTVQP
ncbi:MAG: DNA primase, partial [Thermomicrobiales bacterium]